MSFDTFIDVERRLQGQLDAGTKEIMHLKEEILLLRSSLAVSNVQSEKIMELYGNIEAFLRIANLLERFFVGVTKIAAGLGVIWAIYKYGVLEAIKSARDFK